MARPQAILAAFGVGGIGASLGFWHTTVKHPFAGDLRPAGVLESELEALLMALWLGQRTRPLARAKRRIPGDHLAAQMEEGSYPRPVSAACSPPYIAAMGGESLLVVLKGSVIVGKHLPVCFLMSVGQPCCRQTGREEVSPGGGEKADMVGKQF